MSLGSWWCWVILWAKTRASVLLLLSMEPKVIADELPLREELGDVRRLPGRPRCPPRRGLPCVSGLKQLPKPVCQLFDGLLQGAELPNPD